MTDTDPLRLLRYLWSEADLERPGGGRNPVGTPAKVRELFRADDPLSVDIEAALAAGVTLARPARKANDTASVVNDPRPAPRTAVVFTFPDGTTGPGHWDSDLGAVVPDPRPAPDATLDVERWWDAMVNVSAREHWDFTVDGTAWNVALVAIVREYAALADREADARAEEQGGWP